MIILAIVAFELILLSDHSECEAYKEYQNSRKVLNYTISAKKQEERDISEFRLGKKNKK